MGIPWDSGKESNDQLITRKVRLAEKVEAKLLAAIESGRFSGILPGEHELSKLLMVSRPILRDALNNLAAKAVIKKHKGAHTRILRPGSTRATSQPAQTICLLTPQKITEFTPFMYQWYHHYRSLMAKEGTSLQLKTAPGVFQHFSSQKMEVLIHASPADLFILHISTKKMQQWFVAQNTQAILAGTPYPGVHMPFVDVDQRAAARHATGLLIAKGHRSILMTTAEDMFAGDNASLQGLEDAVSGSRSKQRIDYRVVGYNEEPNNLHLRMTQALASADRPTALIICHQWIVPAVLCVLNKSGLKMGRDISIVCLQQAPFMKYMTPSLACYNASAEQFSTKLAALSQHMLNLTHPTHIAHWIIPEFIPGETLSELIIQPGDTSRRNQQV